MSNYIDEGYIKFDINWEKGKVPNNGIMSSLMEWRDKMYGLGLIGFYKEHQVGYGNISVKVDDGFIISGTQTGHLPQLKEKHYTLVDSYKIDENRLHCIGPIKASSESLTHAAIYECNTEIKAIIHIHHNDFWRNALDKIPTSSKEIPYGTPEMAKEIFHLYNNTSFSNEKIMAMAGHEEGIIAFGNTLEETGSCIESYFAKFAG